ncbi:DUF6929 family protein [Flavobacterium wongokense]|uniref:DUF6929 family protein n=1 Tax=Flavobacterium wongokense TaxID=2910674 RepID=UPI001F1968D1|nr:hypothetical protein [Flavobacterium sp. WG47]MCF6132408.1 hypothetical protein [Flavobacterium sp. WG47]
MEKFQLSILFKIIGLGSASGLFYQDDLLYVISDNSTYLYEYNIPNEKLNKIPLVENAQENIPKNEKPDFESIMFNGSHISIIGSGSAENRNAIALYHLELKKPIIKSMSSVYTQIKIQNHINDDDLNIEGMVTTGRFVYFFQRGNGVSGKNGIFYSETNEEKKIPDYGFIPFDLPKIKNVPATFTDAILVDDKIYFLASAEDTTSTYLDGEVLGSLIGTIDLNTMTLEKTLQISDKHKFEGLTLYKNSAAQIEFLLCEDTDSEISESNIYKLVIDKTQ